MAREKICSAAETRDPADRLGPVPALSLSRKSRRILQISVSKSRNFENGLSKSPQPRRGAMEPRSRPGGAGSRVPPSMHRARSSINMMSDKPRSQLLGKGGGAGRGGGARLGKRGGGDRPGRRGRVMVKHDLRQARIPVDRTGRELLIGLFGECWSGWWGISFLLWPFLPASGWNRPRSTARSSGRSGHRRAAAAGRGQGRAPAGCSRPRADAPAPLAGSRR